MKTYTINKSEKKMGIAQVNQFAHGHSYKPKTNFGLWYEEGVGFHLTMGCYEKNPVAIYKNHGDPVYKDSCMEFFVNFYPEQKTTGYLNFEMNALGTMLLGYGTERSSATYKRISKVALLEKKHEVNQEVDYWEIRLLIPLDFIQSIYGRCDFANGSIIKANAYKCGDETEQIHYGAWNRVETKKPDFHRPDFFGTMVIAG